MTLLGTALCLAATRVMLLGSGGLGKEVAIECQRFGVEVIAVDRYVDVPATYVTHRFYVINMFDDDALCRVVGLEKPHYTVSEIEAIATDMLIQPEERGLNVVPRARATKLTMNREGIRRLAAEELQLPTSTHRLADGENLFREVVIVIGYPCIVEPVMSPSGKEQTFTRSVEQPTHAWECAQQGGCAGAGRIIVEGVVKPGFEVTLLAVSAMDGVHLYVPVGHRQEDGDYREFWQPQRTSLPALERAQEIARKVVLALGGHGLFGVELSVCGNEVIFSEVSPRPHDTRMVTLTSQDLSEFALHVRTFLGLPVGGIRQYSSAASVIILLQLTSQNVMFDNVQNAIGADLQIRSFGKLEIDGSCRLGVALATAESVVDAIERVEYAAGQVKAQG